MTKSGQTFHRNIKAKKIFGNLKKFYSLVVLVTLVFGALFVYLLEVNSIAAKGFKVRDLEKNIQLIEEENEKLEVAVVEMQATSRLVERIQKLGLVAVDKVEYFGGAGTVVAQR